MKFCGFSEICVPYRSILIQFRASIGAAFIRQIMKGFG